MRKERIGGWLAIEDHRLPWDALVELDRDRKIVVCGELGHVRWLLYRSVWVQVVKRDLELALASRVDAE